MLLALLTAAACEREMPGYIQPETPEQTEDTGFLTLSPTGIYVVMDAETDQDVESSAPTAQTRADDKSTIDPTTGVPYGNEADATNDLDSFRIKIEQTESAYDNPMTEPAFSGTYAFFKSKISQETNGFEVPVGTYRITATSNVDAGAPTQVQAKPSYEAHTDEVKVTKGVATPVGTLTCTLQNIKVTVEVAADLYEMLAPISAGGSELINSAVYYGEDLASATHKWEIPAAWDWRNSDPKPVYFPALEERNTLHFYFKARLKSSANDTGTLITMNKEIPNIMRGQWRKIKVIPKYDTQGNLTFEVEISTLVQDDTIVVGDSGNAGVAIAWSELPYDDPDAPTKGLPSIRWEDGTELPETIVVGSTPIQPVRFTIPNGVEKIGLKFDSTNPDFAAEVSALQIDDLCALSHNALLSAYGIPYGADLKGVTELEFVLSEIEKQIGAHEGQYTFTFTLTDVNDNSIEYSIRFMVGAGAENGPIITWAGGMLYNDDGYDAAGKPKADAPFVTLEAGMQIILQLAALPNFESIAVKITSEVLTAELLAAAGLPTEFDLCELKEFEYDGDKYSPESQATVLTQNLQLIDKVNDDLKKESSAKFDITPFVDILLGLGEGNDKFQFALTVKDAQQRPSTKYLRLQTPAK